MSTQRAPGPDTRGSYLPWLILLAAGYAYATLLTWPSLDLPFCGYHLWNSCATAMAMRSYEDFGFLHLAGKVLWIPRTAEWNAADILRHNVFHHGYPALYVHLPYLAFKMIGLVRHVDIDFAYIQTYSLICNRLASCLLLFLVFEQTLVRCLPGAFGAAQTRALACLATLTWLLSPGTLYNTQNIYYSDQAVFLPVMVLVLIALRTDLFRRPMRLQWPILMLVSLWATGCEWYGSAMIAACIALALLRDVLARPSGEPRTAVRAIPPLLAGMACTLALYAFQITRAPGRLTDPGNKLLSWLGTTDWDELARMLGRVASWWREYLPGAFENAGPVVLAALAAPLLLAWAVCLAKALSGVNRLARVEAGCLLALLVLPPAAYALLLLKHSAVHDYSLFKLSPAFALLACGPVVLAALSVRHTAWRTAAIAVPGALLVLAQVWGLQGRYEVFSLYECPLHADQGRFVARHFRDDPVVVSRGLNNLSAPMGSSNPVPTWYAWRTVYTPEAMVEFAASGLITLPAGPVTFADFAGDPAFVDYGVCRDAPVTAVGDFPVPGSSPTPVLTCRADQGMLALFVRLVGAKTRFTAPGTEIDLLDQDSGRRAWTAGLGGVETGPKPKTWRWGSGPETTAAVVLRQPGTVRLALEIFSAAPGQAVSVLWNGEPAGMVDADKASADAPVRFEAVLPARRGINELRLAYRTWNGLPRAFAPGDDRKLAACYSRLSLEVDPARIP